MNKFLTFTVFILFCVTVSGADIKSLSTDKASYSPLDTVTFNLELNTGFEGNKFVITILHLIDTVEIIEIIPDGGLNITWKWIAPAEDYKGYLAEVNFLNDNTLIEKGTIAIDVSSEWKKFPRYGFLSKFGFKSDTEINNIISNLNRHHINGIQFYDWQYKHHLPLKGSPESPASTWLNIANETVYFSTVQKYIDAAHSYNMKAMNYNLLYGAYQDARYDGADDKWRLFKDNQHQTPDFHDLPDNWASDIYLMDISNPKWRSYLLKKEKDAFKALSFDGFHIDQLGGRGSIYNYDGTAVELWQHFTGFINEAKDSLKNIMVMNAVGQYGQKEIAAGDVDFLYTELWGDGTFNDLINTVKQNQSFGISKKLNSVLAAYMNYNLAKKGTGFFNTPGILLADAVIFASGGSHLELGEHMLNNEYFPNSNLRMTSELKNRLINYYDFMTAYENILRDEVSDVVFSTYSNIETIRTYFQLGSVYKLSKIKGDNIIIHLINFKNCSTLEWRDTEGTQTHPGFIQELSVRIPLKGIEVEKVWAASPDINGGVPQILNYTAVNDTLKLVVPSIEYWTMLVIKRKNSVGIGNTESNKVLDFRLSQNYPNPFNPATTIEYSIPSGAETLQATSLRVYDILGREVAVLVNQKQPAGNYEVKFDASGLGSGMYIYRLKSGSFSDSKRMMLVK